jgi:ribosomal-protein-alanine N-acetyltransferase
MLTVCFEPFPILKTSRLVLRRISADDVECVFRMRSDPQMMKYVPRPLVTSRHEALNHIRQIEKKIAENDGINWAITQKETDVMIGIIGLYVIKKEHYRAELGYMILPEFHGKGIMSEAIEGVLKYGFENMKLHSIEAIIDPDNIASEKVLLNNGFIKEAHLRENEFWNGKFIDTVIYSKLHP